MAEWLRKQGYSSPIIYDINLKKSRLSILKEAGLKFVKVDITDKTVLDKFFATKTGSISLRPF